jgi:hypothetical protein
MTAPEVKAMQRTIDRLNREHAALREKFADALADQADSATAPLEARIAALEGALEGALGEAVAFTGNLECECDSYHGHTCARCNTLASLRAMLADDGEK